MQAYCTVGDPLLQQRVRNNVRCDCKVLWRPSVFIALGFIMLVSQALKGRRLFVVQEPAIAVASALGPRFSSAQIPAYLPNRPSSYRVASKTRRWPGFMTTWFSSKLRHRPVAMVASSSVPEPRPFEPGNLSATVTTSAGVQMPRVIYGTAFKKGGKTESLVMTAVRAGFRGVDTAPNDDLFTPFGPEQYNETGVGAALARLLAYDVNRDGMFVQTKVNPNYAHNLNPNASIADQVRLSIEKSLNNLGLEYVDSVLLHWPYPEYEQTMEAWRGMEGAVQDGLVRQLGIANVRSLDELRSIHTAATIKPAVVQQRFQEETFYENEMRAWCAGNGMHFQSMGTLTLNRAAVETDLVRIWSIQYGVSSQVLFFRFLMGLGIVPLTGAEDEQRMKDYLKASQVELDEKKAEFLKDMMR
eukprot:gnl/TRDRNA2_/TRDRNA2_188755_c0_seq1.p1 gnl/TRDRNA2_/TRDRNA2_188755_c0~~gnl/TRDRNA2_/TRDRNA2_188755_c0_seq1.p1  ORF type:complete len:414 (-),score=44.06 gnl/TRDRNA2_/TRDRNA2_188755_c0_seq1:53-1294(-)